MPRNFVIAHNDLGLTDLNNLSIVELTDDAYNTNMRGPDGHLWPSVADVSVEGWDLAEELNEWTAADIRQLLETDKPDKHVVIDGVKYKLVRV